VFSGNQCSTHPPLIAIRPNMATGPAKSIFNAQGLLLPWDSFLADDDNSFDSTSVTAAGISTPALHCKVSRLWNLEFDTDANTTQFPAQRSQSPESLLLPLTASSTSTVLPPLLQILDLFGITQNQRWRSYRQHYQLFPSNATV
jgi:hypothetical protein